MAIPQQPANAETEDADVDAEETQEHPPAGTPVAMHQHRKFENSVSQEIRLTN
jgi:hypothetical protein